MKIYGPYTRKDGRQHVIVYENGKRKTVSYPKYLLQEKLGRELGLEETCDHIDNDFTNNSVENLQVLSRAENARKEMALHPAEIGTFSCPLCNEMFSREMRLVRGNWKKGRSGPYCSRSCAGKASHLSYNKCTPE
jgi:SOS-response transcriptional repressor LexA